MSEVTVPSFSQFRMCHASTSALATVLFSPSATRRAAYQIHHVDTAGNIRSPNVGITTTRGNDLFVCILELSALSVFL
jgi:hypothetical protein